MSCYKRWARGSLILIVVLGAAACGTDEDLALWGVSGKAESGPISGPVTFDRGPRDSKKMALTFDGDYFDNAMPSILETLGDLRCTFFVTGRWVRTYPETARELVARGHEVANHMNTHPHLTTSWRDGSKTLPGVTRQKVHGQLLPVEVAFEKATGQPMAKLWRAPSGEYNDEIGHWAAEIGYRHIYWTANSRGSLDTLDWVADKSSKIYRTAEEIRRRVVDFESGRKDAGNGGIILMHMGTQRTNDFPHSELGNIVSALQARGHELVTVSELLGL